MIGKVAVIQAQDSFMKLALLETVNHGAGSWARGLRCKYSAVCYWAEYTASVLASGNTTHRRLSYSLHLPKSKWWSLIMFKFEYKNKQNAQRHTVSTARKKARVFQPRKTWRAIASMMNTLFQITDDKTYLKIKRNDMACVNWICM